MFDDLRRQMDDWWCATDAEAMAAKDSQRATLALVEKFRALTPDERTLADVVIGEWVLSTEERKRFDALAVIEEVSVRSAIPQLRLLESKLERQHEPDASFELKKVRRILAALDEVIT